MFSGIPFLSSAPRVAVVPLSGIIAAGAPGGRGLGDARLAPVLERAFRRGKPAAVAFAINSPGGSPVQSALIGARIRRLSEETKVPALAFVEDVAASGGYWLAAAADEIFADAASIVGSIGVIYAGFGFHALLERNGVERRVHTAGTDKSMLDPFLPERPEDVERLRHLQGRIHEQFIAHVRARRGTRLSAEEELFTGRFWDGARALELGLIDGLGHLEPVLRARFGAKTRFVHYGPRRGLLPRIGLDLAAGALDLAEERAMRAHYGL
ncbi:MAG: S49 family peptidase [Alphaproteobacteria bacterium HGW-Alphaproteobacteria-2]|nr:MAG: S49 family peptidase [Alphaproteobacteria bacterium HGW-Alphaproteobacteria-2]